MREAFEAVLRATKGIADPERASFLKLPADEVRAGLVEIENLEQRFPKPDFAQQLDYPHDHAVLHDGGIPENRDVLR